MHGEKDTISCHQGGPKVDVPQLVVHHATKHLGEPVIDSGKHAENGAHQGVGIWPGMVKKLSAAILPHMGWNTVEINPDSILFKGIESESFYFVHSYAAKRAVGKMQAWSTHGEKFLAAVEDGYISATQFHPEKSGSAGLALIKNWVGSL